MAQLDDNQIICPVIGSEPEPESGSGKDGSPKRMDNKPQSFANQFRKTRMCRFHLAKKCTRGANCTHAHSESELQFAPDLSKTSMCRDMVEKGECNRPNCNYAHHLSELKCSNTFFKTRYCRFFIETGSCKLGDKCRYAHHDSEIRDQSEAKMDKPGFQKQSMHNEVSDLKQHVEPYSALPYTNPTSQTILAKEALAKEQADQASMQEMIARQNLMATMMPPQAPPQPVADGSKSHEEMAQMFVAAAQAHLLEADRQKMQRAVQPMMGLQQPSFAGHPMGMMPAARPMMPMQQPMYAQQPMYTPMPYQTVGGYSVVPEAMSPPDQDLPRAASSALAPSKLPKPPSHHSLKGLGGSSATLKALGGSSANLKGLGSTASLKNLEAAARKALEGESPLGRKSKHAVSFDDIVEQEELLSQLRQNYVTKNTFIEVPDYNAIEKEALKRVHMSAPMGLSAWKGGLSASLGGFLGSDQFSEEGSNIDQAENRDIRFDF